MISIGQVISGKYKLLRLLGDGGMGSVYEAQHEVLGTRVAIKVLHQDLTRRPGLIERFLQEARVAAQIESPNVVRVSDVDRTPDGIAYIVMELLQGEPLSAVLERDRKVPIPTAIEYARQILTALEAAHALGVTHRDLKPENVFVTFQGGKPVVKIIDFGIAKLRAPTTTGRSLTQAGITMGTAEYMAPEQAFSADKADARSDIYAVGVMIYELVSGERPASGEDARIIAVKVERGEVKPLVHAAPDVPRELAGLVHRAMASRPEVRFQTATDMRIALENVKLGGANDSDRPPTKPVNAQPAPQQEPPPPQPQAQPLAPPLAPQGRSATVMAAPPAMAAYAAASAEAERTAPPYASPPQHGNPYAAAANTPSPAQNYPPQRKKRGSGLWLLVIPLLLGVGVVVTLVIVQAQTETTSPPEPLFTANTAPTITPTDQQPTATTPVPTATNGTIAPLLTTNGTTPVPPSTVHPPASGGTTHPTATSNNPPTLPIPSIPSGFPTAFPSTLPFQIPSSFPPFGLPTSPVPT
ncbi:MAG: protein kinase domain-containing protein, partial [Polyangiaceae bacterium]